MKNNTTTLHDEIKFNDREPGSKAVKEPEVWKLRTGRGFAPRGSGDAVFAEHNRAGMEV